MLYGAFGGQVIDRQASVLPEPPSNASSFQSSLLINSNSHSVRSRDYIGRSASCSLWAALFKDLNAQRRPHLDEKRQTVDAGSWAGGAATEAANGDARGGR